MVDTRGQRVQSKVEWGLRIVLEADGALELLVLLNAAEEARAVKDRERVIQLIGEIYALLDGKSFQPADPVWLRFKATDAALSNERRVPSLRRSTLVNGSGLRLQNSRRPIRTKKMLPPIFFEQIVQTAGDIIIVTEALLDPPGPLIVYVNSAFTRLTGFSTEEAMGKSPRMLQGSGTNRQALDRVAAGLQAGTPVREKILNYSKWGAPYWLDMRILPLRDPWGRITHFAAIERDVTMDKRRLDELEYLADRDTLTGIPNRRALLKGLDAELAAAGEGAGGVGPCLALIDVDLFKQVNDTLGHPAGDAVLIGLADRLSENARRLDVVGRLGGDEFAVFMPNVPLQDAVALAERLGRAVAREPFNAPGGPVILTVSIGVAGYALGGNKDEMLVRADCALYQAKQLGRNSVRSYVEMGRMEINGTEMA